jgi:hypothetical protein
MQPLREKLVLCAWVVLTPILCVAFVIVAIVDLWRTGESELE